MKIINLFKISIFTSSFITTTYVTAQPKLTIGNQITQQELAKINGEKVIIDDQSFKVISETITKNRTTRGISTQSSPNTFVANNQGVIGSSQNIVIISEAPPMQVRSIAKNIVNSAVSTQYYEHLNVSTLQFRNFNQAVTAYHQLVKLFPNATITVPIKFSEPSPR